MVQHQRYLQLKKGLNHHQIRVEQDEGTPTKNQNQTLVLELGNTSYYRRTKPRILPLILLFSIVSCSLIFIPRVITSYSLEGEKVGLSGNEEEKLNLCSSMPYGSICCDRSGVRSDVCFMKGDVRTHSASSSFFVYAPDNVIEEKVVSNGTMGDDFVHEKIRPYTRKWETSIMETIEELDLVVKKKGSDISRPCDVQHSVPAVVFSTGGYTGNVYHEFNDGLIPLYITSQHFKKNVVFVVLDYHNWWLTKYGDILSRLSNYAPIDYNKDQRTHCFPEAIVGLRIHDELTIDSSLVQGNKGIRDFRKVLDKAYWPRIRGLILKEEAKAQLSATLAPQQVKSKESVKKPKLVILSRNGSRAILNQNLLVNMAEEIGFEVKVLKPDKTTELAKIYRVLNSSDAMIGVHGAAMTHFLFMKPTTVFIQVIPLGTDWPAEMYYGAPSRKLGLEYIEYKVLPEESSLYMNYKRDDPVLTDPNTINAKGWQFTKRIYLDGQNVNLDLRRFRKQLVRAYKYTISKRSQGHS
ncbi:protein O-GlcNAc transferase [Ranunculus cassubicifolius]